LANDAIAGKTPAVHSVSRWEQWKETIDHKTGNPINLSSKWKK